jgi:hypothetical protein
MSDSIEVDLDRGLYEGRYAQTRVRTQGGLVCWLVGDKAVTMRTLVAHRVGFALVKKSAEAGPGELVSVKINGDSIQFIPNNARQVGGALLRKADDADDFQIQRTS